MLIDDADALRLRALISTAAAGFESEHMSSVADLIWRRVRRPRGTLHGLAEDKASQYLGDCINYVEAEALTIARRYCSAQWLWLLRRVPRELFAEASVTTWQNRLVLAEAVSAKGAIKVCHHSAASRRAPVPIDRKTASTTVRFVALTKTLGRLQAIYRICNKGGRLTLRPYEMPTLEIPDNLQRAIDLYDLRNRTAHYIRSSGITGTVLLAVANDLSSNDTVLAAEALRSSIQVAIPELIPDFAANSVWVDGDVPHVAATWAPIALNLASLRDLPSSKFGAAWQPELGALLVLMRLAALLSAERGGGFWPTLLRTGYVCGNSKTFSAMFGRVAAEMAPQLVDLAGITVAPENEAIESLHRLGNDHVWPATAGPPVRFSPATVYIDIASCTRWVERLAEFAPVTSTGALANVRGEHFEKAVQRIIDETRWMPGERVSGYVGRTLRLDGNRITDVDAIGEKDESLLLVSAKSYPYSVAYQRGDHTAIRNLQTKLAEDLASWQKKVRRISRFPVGDNYDFRAYRELIPVVITPFPAYLSNEDLTSEATPGLRVVSSIAELDSWARL